jgi:murein DD-endopeptidase MepM/ murein hydrolase activator NlpD
VRKLVLLACAALLVAALKYTDQPGFRAFAGGVTLPFKAALLYAKDPDRELALPVEGVRAKQIKDSWHAPRSGGRLHEGQDIFARRGAAVRSATEGYVVRVGESPLGGNTVFVLGAGGRSYYYAHLDSYAPGLAVGDYVTLETVLGYVGATGNAAGTPPHLHFGVYTPSGAIDPLPLLADRPSRVR